MSAQGYYEDQLEEAIANLFRYYHTGGGVRLTREDAMKRLNGNEIVEIWPTLGDMRLVVREVGV